MKTPIILKIFAVLNLIIALVGLFIGAAFVIDFSDNYTIWNRDFILSLYIIVCSGWLFVGSLSWIFGFRSAFGLLIISVISIFSFFIGVLNYAFEVGVNQKDEKIALSILIIGFSVYAIFILSSVFSKQVKDWRAARPEMKKLIMPLLLAFSILLYGSHLAIAFGLPNEILNKDSSQDYSELEDAMEYEYAEEAMADDGDYEEEYYEDDYYEGDYEEPQGDYAYYNEPFEYSAPANVSTSYPAPSGGKTISREKIDLILTGFFNGFLANDWSKQDAFHNEGNLTIKLGTKTHDVGTYYLGMASIYEKINPYFTSGHSIDNVADCYIYCYAKELSGIDPLLVKSEGNRDFNKYNPEIIKWMYTHLVPPQDANFLSNVMAKELYGQVFKRFFRMYTQAYFYLISRDFASEKEAYMMSADQDMDFYGPSYLYERYNGAISMEYDGSLDPTSAIGFWLRRSIDNTDDECWLGIQKVMNRYDATWFQQMKNIYMIDNP